MRPAMGLADIQIDQQGGDRLGTHAGTAIGMQGQAAGRDVLLGDGVGDQLLGQFGGLPMGDHPAHHVTAEDVEDHVQMEAGPLCRPAQLRDIPRPHFVGLDRQQLGLGIGGVDQLVAPLAHLIATREQPIQGPHRAEIDPLIEQGGVDLPYRAIGETIAVEGTEDTLPLAVAERQRRPAACGRRSLGRDQETGGGARPRPAGRLLRHCRDMFVVPNHLKSQGYSRL